LEEKGACDEAILGYGRGDHDGAYGCPGGDAGVGEARGVHPCIGSGDEEGTITTTENGVFHLTASAIDANGNPIPPFHLNGMVNGTFLAVPDDSSLPTYTGHFTSGFSANIHSGPYAETDTFHVIGNGSDGSTIKFHETLRVLVDADGNVTVVFDKATCG
jgi:hypothetical protein